VLIGQPRPPLAVQGNAATVQPVENAISSSVRDTISLRSSGDCSAMVAAALTNRRA